MKRGEGINERTIKFISFTDARENGEQKCSCYIPRLLATVLIVSAIFFVLSIFEVQQDSDSSLSVKNNFAFALEAPPLSFSPIPTNPPILNVPGDNYVEATSSAGAQVNYIVTATATLPVSGSSGNTATDKDVRKQQQQPQQQVPLSPVCSPQSGSLFPIGTTTVTCTVIDRYSTGSNGGGGGGTGSISNNDRSITKSFKIVVRDTTAPGLTLPADSLTIKANGDRTTAISYSTHVSALDIVDGTVTPICSPPSGSPFPIGTTTVSCNANDRHGNTATGSFSITVRYPVFGGFSEPIDPNGNSVFKLGSTIPIRFQLKWPDGQPVIDAKAQIYNAKISDKIVGGGLGESGSIAQERQGKVELNGAPAGTTASASAAPPDVRPPSSGNYFTYDSSSGLYTFNLGSGNLSAGTWQIKIVLDDGSTHTVNISLVD